MKVRRGDPLSILPLLYHKYILSWRTIKIDSKSVYLWSLLIDFNNLFGKYFFSSSQELRIQTILHRIRIWIWILLESDLISKKFYIYFVISMPFKVDAGFYSKIILYKNRILPYYTFLTKKSLLSVNLGMIFWLFWSMFCSLRIRIQFFFRIRIRVAEKYQILWIRSTDKGLLTVYPFAYRELGRNFCETILEAKRAFYFSFLMDMVGGGRGCAFMGRFSRFFICTQA